MAIPEAKIRLEKFIANSLSLSPENKELIKNSFDTLSEEQINNLNTAFAKEQEQLTSIKNTYEAKQLPLKIQYLKIIEEFKRGGLKKALQGWESADEKDKEQNLQNLLQELNKKTEQHSSKKEKKLQKITLRFLLIAGLIALFITGYILLTPMLKK